MNDIDRYLDQACRQVSGPDSLRQHLRKELKEHLEEAIDALVATGMSQDEATAKAIEDLGEPEMIREGMQSVYGPSVTSLFVDQAMQWKERTMKSDWKWNFTAQVGLALSIALPLGVSYLLMILVAPKVEATYQHAGVELPVYYQGMKSVAVFLHRYFLGLILLVAVVGLFEWKCKSENKTLIRTAMFVGLSLISAAGVFWMAGVLNFCLVEIAPVLAGRSG